MADRFVIGLWLEGEEFCVGHCRLDAANDERLIGSVTFSRHGEYHEARAEAERQGREKRLDVVVFWDQGQETIQEAP